VEIFRHYEPKRIHYLIPALLLQFLILAPFVWAESPSFALKGERFHFTINPNRSSVRFLASSTFHRIEGEAKEFKGEVLLSSLNDPSTGRVILQIEALGLDANHKGINKKMREDCLEVNRFPLIRFQSLEIRNGPKGYSLGQRARADVEGLLDLHGVTRRVSIPVDFQYTEETFSVHGKVTIKMSDFQIPDPNFLFLRIKDEIEISFDIHGFALASPA